ncbi:hypothetical protein [Pseudodesulfovibrio senegalensis]|uniref:Flagellar protein FliT n=1 Tax=Pseudodesulfovibrio senegalensis TaxID=1721087 RepID=A0A6N6N678_9BACT|nr:hypothetical protein [Pseudodesulfovibrio senegalensis]KAB1443526.1 hypothetical protein F8A88_04575 [Pseudodesulfovibrio senegalensis]
MDARRKTLNEVLEMGRRELKHLLAGDVMEAEELARERCDKAQQVLSGLDKESVQALEGELRAFDSLQRDLTAEASLLKDRVRDELTNLRKQSKRLAGYKVGAGFTKSGFNRSRFVSRTG